MKKTAITVQETKIITFTKKRFIATVVFALLFMVIAAAAPAYAAPSAAVYPSSVTAYSPTSSASVSAVACEVIKFFSETILPPIAVLMMLVVGFLFMIGGQMPQKAIAARKTLLYVAAGVMLLLIAPAIVTLVVDVTGATTTLTACSSFATITTRTITGTITSLVNWFAWFVSILSVAMGLYAGVLYLTARDDSSQMMKATKALSYTIIGVAVSVVSFSIIILTKTLLGI